MPDTLLDYFKWNCTGCGALNESDDNVTGKAVTCRECGKVQIVSNCTLASWNN